MAGQAQLEARLRAVHKTAGVIVTVLGNVQARVPGTFPENLDELHTAIKRGELRRVLKCAEDLVAEVDEPIPDDADEVERQARRGERKKKRAAKKKKKTGG
jgi:hypothetical protein